MLGEEGVVWRRKSAGGSSLFMSSFTDINELKPLGELFVITVLNCSDMDCNYQLVVL